MSRGGQLTGVDLVAAAATDVRTPKGDRVALHDALRAVVDMREGLEEQRQVLDHYVPQVFAGLVSIGCSKARAARLIGVSREAIRKRYGV